MGYGFRKLASSFFLLGLCGMLIETFYTALTYAITTHKYISLMGQTSIWSLIVFGIGGVLLALINDKENFYSLSMRIQTFLGGIILILTELICGIGLNLSPLKLNIWNYSGFGNFLGQIDLIHSICWICFTPLFIWIKDTVIDFGLYREQKWVYHLLDNYKELIFGKINNNNEGRD